MQDHELLKNADMAMYQAKNQGRNNFQFFTSTLNDQLREQLALESDLHGALEKGEFVLYFQPQVNLQTRRLTGMEALIRWNHPTRGMVPPSMFIGIAEECGLIHEITRWVLEQACARMRPGNPPDCRADAWRSISLRQILDMLICVRSLPTCWRTPSFRRNTWN